MSFPGVSSEGDVTCRRVLSIPPLYQLFLESAFFSEGDSGLTEYLLFKIYKLLNLLKLEKLFFVGSPIVTTLGGSWAVIMAVYIVLFGLNFGQNRPFFALQKSNFGFAFENERTVRCHSEETPAIPANGRVVLYAYITGAIP